MSRNVLDELFDEVVYRQLRAWRISIDRVGVGFGQLGWSDERIRKALHGSRKTFHTRDRGHYHRRYCHPSYCLVYYDVPAVEMAIYVRRLLHHPQLNTHAKRMGKVIKVAPKHIEFWQVNSTRKQRVKW